MNRTDLISGIHINHTKTFKLIRRAEFIDRHTRLGLENFRLVPFSVLPLCGRSAAQKSRQHNTIFIGPTHVKVAGPCHSHSAPLQGYICPFISISLLVFCLACPCGLFIYFFNLLLLCVLVWLSFFPMPGDEEHNSK